MPPFSSPPPPSPNNNPDPYVLARDFKSASRLNYEHYLWHATLGYNIHPNILSDLETQAKHLQRQQNEGETEISSVSAFFPPQIKIADLACGTAIFLTQLSATRTNHYDSSSSLFHGYDISLAQAPPPALLPDNVRLRKWDIFSEPGEDMLAVRGYDVVHVRLLFVVVNEEETGVGNGGKGRGVKDVLGKMMRLVRAGGWVQWDELDVAGSSVLRAGEGEENDSGGEKTLEKEGYTDKVVKYLQTQGKWVGELDKRMQECGFVDVKLLRIEEKKELAKAFFDNHLAKDEEMAEGALKGTQEGRAMKERLEKLYGESTKGTFICTPKVVCIARRPLAGEVG